MNVILSIKPKYTDAILSRKKRYEFRKREPKLRVKNQKAYIYTTSPVRKITASFEIKCILENHPKVLWRKLWRRAGIDERRYSEYFGARKIGFAIEIGCVKKFNPPIEPQKLFENFVPPQSFRYVPPSWEELLRDNEL